MLSQANRFQDVLRPPCIGTAIIAMELEGEADILQRRQGLEEIVALEDEPEAASDLDPMRKLTIEDPAQRTGATAVA